MSGWVSDGHFSAKRRRVLVILGAFERQWTLTKRIPCVQQRSARSDEVKSRNLRVGCGEVLRGADGDAVSRVYL